MKTYKVMAAPIILYGSETWVPKQKEINKIQSAEMKFLGIVKGLIFFLIFPSVQKHDI